MRTAFAPGAASGPALIFISAKISLQIMSIGMLTHGYPQN